MNAIATRIYAADVTELKNEDLFRTAYQTVTKERQKKTDRLRLHQDKCLSLGAELLLLQGLKRSGLDHQQLTYSYGANGKPYLSEVEDVYFNLSHSGDLVICAISSQEIGCDVERISDRDSDIARRFFSPEEYELIAGQDTETLRREMFFRLWTLKESFIKSTGMGMHLPMRAFCICFGDGGISVKQELNSYTYYFQEYNIWQNYKCSVCGLDAEIGEKSAVPLVQLDLLDN